MTAGMVSLKGQGRSKSSRYRSKEGNDMRLSDEIAAYIYGILEQAEDGSAELQRNELAEKLGCVPSQINYVLTSRFTPEQGFVVESRAGRRWLYPYPPDPVRPPGVSADAHGQCHRREAVRFRRPRHRG